MQESNTRPQRRRAMRGGLVVLLLLLAGAVFVYSSFKTVIVEGISMLDTLKPGDELMVTNAYWLFGGISRNDVVVVAETDKGYFIKRVYRLGGETIAVDDLLHLPESHDASTGPYRVPLGTIYLIGDNLPESEDSRKFGPINVERVIGKAVRL